MQGGLTHSEWRTALSSSAPSLSGTYCVTHTHVWYTTENNDRSDLIQTLLKPILELLTSSVLTRMVIMTDRYDPAHPTKLHHHIWPQLCPRRDGQRQGPNQILPGLLWYHSNLSVRYKVIIVVFLYSFLFIVVLRLFFTFDLVQLAFRSALLVFI